MAINRSSPDNSRPSNDNCNSRTCVNPYLVTYPSCAPLNEMASRPCVISMGTCLGPSTKTSRTIPPYDNLRPSRALDCPSIYNEEWEGVARPALRQSSPNVSPDPQFTITARLPDVISKASVEACAFTAARPCGGISASTIIEVRPEERRANPMANPSEFMSRLPDCNNAWSNRPSNPRPPP